MALVAADLQKIEKVEQELKALQHTVMNSLNFTAVGGSHIVNKLLDVIPVVEELKAKIDAEIV